VIFLLVLRLRFRESVVKYAPHQNIGGQVNKVSLAKCFDNKRRQRLTPLKVLK